MKKLPSTIVHLVRGGGVLLLFFMISLGIQQIVGQATIEKWISLHPDITPFIIVSLKALTVVFAPLSGSGLYVLVGSFLPTLPAFIYLTIGNFLGITVSYYLGSRYGDKILARCFDEKTLIHTHQLIDRLHNKKSFLMTRIVLFFAEDLINYLAGMSKVPYRRFISVSMILTSAVMVSIVWGTDLLQRLVNLLNVF